MLWYTTKKDCLVAQHLQILQPFRKTHHSLRCHGACWCPSPSRSWRCPPPLSGPGPELGDDHVGLHISMGFHGISWDINSDLIGTPWVLMGFDGISMVISKIFIGFYKILMGYQWWLFAGTINLWDFKKIHWDPLGIKSGWKTREIHRTKMGFLYYQRVIGFLDIEIVNA